VTEVRLPKSATLFARVSHTSTHGGFHTGFRSPGAPSRNWLADVRLDGGVRGSVQFGLRVGHVQVRQLHPDLASLLDMICFVAAERPRVVASQHCRSIAVHIAFAVAVSLKVDDTTGSRCSAVEGFCRAEQCELQALLGSHPAREANRRLDARSGSHQRVGSDFNATVCPGHMYHRYNEAFRIDTGNLLDTTRVRICGPPHASGRTLISGSRAYSLLAVLL
jgi:hypothetical protein